MNRGVQYALMEFLVFNGKIAAHCETEAEHLEALEVLAGAVEAAIETSREGQPKVPE